MELSPSFLTRTFSLRQEPPGSSKPLRTVCCVCTSSTNRRAALHATSVMGENYKKCRRRVLWSSCVCGVLVFFTYSRFMVWRCEKVPGTRWVILLLCRKLNEKQEEMISHHSPWMHQYQEQLESDSKIFDWHFFKMCNEFPSSSQTCDKLQDVSAKEKNNKFHSFSFEAHNICMCLKQWYAAEPWTHTGDMRLSWLIWTRTLN